MKGIIVYQGKYGATSQYADWIGTELNIQCVAAGAISGPQLQGYDSIIIGSAVYMGKLLVQDWLKKNLQYIHHKKLFLFVVCATTTDQVSILEGYLQGSVPAEIRNRCEVYFLPGRLVMKNLSWLHRMILKMVTRLDKARMNESTLQEFDRVQKVHTMELTNAVKKYVALQALLTLKPDGNLRGFVTHSYN